MSKFRDGCWPYLAYRPFFRKNSGRATQVNKETWVRPIGTKLRDMKNDPCLAPQSTKCRNIASVLVFKRNLIETWVHTRRMFAQGRGRFSPTFPENERKRMSRSRQRHPAVARESLISFFLSPTYSRHFRLVCGRRVSDDPDVGRTGRHNERRIISPDILMRSRAAGRFNNRSPGYGVIA